MVLSTCSNRSFRAKKAADGVPNTCLRVLIFNRLIDLITNKKLHHCNFGQNTNCDEQYNYY